MCVELCCGEGSVTKQLLDGSQIGTTFEHMGSCGVAQAVGCHRCNSWKALCRKGYSLSGRPLIDAAATNSKKKCIVTLRCHQLRSPVADPEFKP